jgi:hypothetical protein
MNRSAKHQRHEKARKQHKHDQQEHAREVAKQPQSRVPMYVLGVVITLMLALVIGVTFWK